MVTVNRTSTQARDAQVIAGIQKHLQNVPSIPLGGSAYTPADLAKLVQSRIDSAATVTAAKAAWHATVVSHEALNTKLTPTVRSLRQYVINVYGATSPVLADFGFAPPKTATRTPEEKAAAAAKAKATRAARHTAGKKQKKVVKGNVTGIVVTPVTAPEEAPVTPAPPAVTPTAAPPTATANPATSSNGATPNASR
ncbi:MAG TPA: hypothetical protein VE987_04860 [Polyangiaceae bacterium]|nr:hypothetical protein [Polyangiaceae bacterium]